MNKKIIGLIFLIGLSIPNLLGQFCPTPPACITNGALEPDNPGTINVFNMNSVTGSTVQGWGVSHGTPSLTTGFSGGGVWMWARTVGVAHSEGIFSCYNFQQGHTYQVCFRVKNTSANNSGNLFVRAVSGLATTPSSSPIPAVPATSQVIHGTHVHDSAWHQYSVSYIPNANYNGIWVYPFSDSNFVNGFQYELVVDDIRINEAQPANIAIGASRDTIFACGSSVLTVNGALPGSTFSWTPATGLSSTSSGSVTAQPCSTTTYTVEIKNPCTNSPCLSFIQKQFTLYVNPGTSVSASPSTISVCGSTTLTASSTNPMNVTWSPATGLSSTSGNVVTASPCETTTYTATFYCPKSGCTYMEQVTVNVQPGSLADSSSTDCYGPINLEYTPSCPGATYKWYGPTNTLLPTTGPKFTKGSSTYSDQGTYMVEVTTPNGCIDTVYAIVIMNCCKIVADFDIIDCNPVRFVNKTLDSVGGNEVLQGEWYWDLGDGSTSTLRNPAHLNVMQLDPRTVCLTAVISTGFSTCCAKICKDFQPCDYSGCPKAAFDYRVVNPGTGDVQLFDKSVGGGYACGWEWTINNAPYPGNLDPAPIIPGLGSGTHLICLKVTYCLPNGQTCDEEWCEEIVIP